ncbi:MAG: NAD-dependent succinate-semialdehyde dehydrogenase [Alphaproteobacteria bacterium]|nr:NAD-dependent succinate-semialdehyde dehydrogenase [Alphaproteobacteria bacterium]
MQTQNLINGNWVGNGDTKITNPANGAELGRVPQFGSAEAEMAVAAAKAAFPSWSGLLAKERAIILRRWFDLVMRDQQKLAAILTAEQGKPLTEAMGEIAYAASYIEFYAEEAKRINGETMQSHIKDGRVIVIRQAIGVVAAITPWNFPAAMITRKLAPAMAVGCTTVLKPAGETPLTAIALAELAVEAGVPDGVINVITGKASEIGSVFCESPDVKALTFTGSTEVGKILMRQCADTVKKLGLELGGNAPFIVFDDADLDAAVEGAIASKYRNAGQTCVCANRLYVHDKVYDAFVEKLKQRVAGLKVGDGVHADTLQGPLINQAAVDKIEQHIEDAISKGAKLVLGGKRHALGGTYFEPTILTEVNKDMMVTGEETFGPLAPIYRFSSDQEVIDLANATEFGLAAYFYAQNISRVWKVAEALEYGMVAINSGLLSSELAPFGGIKESGFGREGSHHGTDEFTNLKYMLMAGI